MSKSRRHTVEEASMAVSTMAQTVSRMAKIITRLLPYAPKSEKVEILRELTGCLACITEQIDD